MKKSLKVKNIFGESLDVLVEGNEKGDEVIVFVHGFGTDKNEGFSSFLDAGKFFQKDYLLVRYDMSGYGGSGGEEKDFQFQKAAGDLDFILRFVRRKYPAKKINIFAHSLGAFVVVLLSPEGIKKTVFTGAINTDLHLIVKKLEKRIVDKNGIVNKNDISVYPRSSGTVQLIGKDFWRTLENVDFLLLLKEFAVKTDLLVIKSKQDEIVCSDLSFAEYKKIQSLCYEEMDGDHNFKDSKDRKRLFKRIEKFLKNKS